MMKKHVKRLLQSIITILGPERINYSTKSRLVILTYHRVIPQTDKQLEYEQPGMYVHPETFRMHMHVLKSRYDLTHIDVWIKKKKKNIQLPKISVAITFDDGWKDNYDYAFPVLKEYEVPATIFLVSDYIGTKYRFWPNRLIRLLINRNISDYINLKGYEWIKDLQLSFRLESQPSLDLLQIDEIINLCKLKTDRELNKRIGIMEHINNRVESKDERDLLDLNEIKTMIDSGLIKIGSHTRTHARLLNTMLKHDMENEIITSKDILHNITGSEIELFCYPNGDYTDEAIDVVADNYLAACTTKKGWNNTDSDLFTFKRIGIHEDICNDRISFLARFSGKL